MQTDAVDEILKTLYRAGDEDADQGVESRIKHLPRTNPDFEASQLYGIMSGQLEGQLGKEVDEAVASEELSFAHGDCVNPDAVDEVIARLVASPSFAGVVLDARSCLQKAARLKSTTCDVPAMGAAAAVGGTTTKDERIHLHRNAMSSSDTEGEGMHSKKKALRMDDWVGTFSLSGGGAGRGFSPRIDVEAVLGQLEAGLGSPGGSATSSIEALGSLAEADPELFQFGNHWTPFLEQTRRALRSPDPAIHAKALSLHWVMYEKSMGMCAADMCEGVLDHAQHYFASTAHALPFPTPNRRTATSARDGGDCGSGVSLAGFGNPELARAAREARALHGMLTTIHEAFQHLPEKRMWSIVSGFLSLFGDADAATATVAVSLEENGDATATVANSDNNNFSLSVNVDNGGGSSSSPAVLLPAHFLAIAGSVDDWLPGWLRALPTGRLVRAVDDAGLVAAMVRRCAALQPQAPFRPRRLNRPRRASPALSGALTGLERPMAVFRPPLSGAAAAVPPGDVAAPPAADLDRALLLQSVSFLGTMAAHCRGHPRPCRPPDSAAAAAGVSADADGNAPPGAGSEDGVPEERAASGTGRGGGLGVDVEQQQQQGAGVMEALAWCVAGGPPPAAEPIGGPQAQRQPFSRRSPSRSVRRVALGYVGQVARAAAGAESTPFTPTVIDVLFSPLDGGNGHWNGSGRREEQAGDSGGGNDGGGSRGTFRRSSFDGEGTGGAPPPLVGVEEEEPASFFEALAEIAGVLLSSRGGAAGFFVDGPAGPEASRALLKIARCAAELARCACWRRSSRRVSGGGGGGGDLGERKGNGAPGGLRVADVWERRFRYLDQGDAERLAVDFACALASMMGYPPKQRAAGWVALWQCDVPRALAALAACLNSPAPEVLVARKVEGRKEHSDRSSASTSLEGCRGGGDESKSGGRGRGSGYDSSGGSSGESWKRDCDLRDRLLLSLVEWARDLVGVSYLRRVGLAGPCGSFLSRELARQHLRPDSRDECADPRPLALAARLSLYAEGLEGLLCADEGIANEVDAGLGRLEQLMGLAELLPSQATGLPPPPLPPHTRALAVGADSGIGGGAVGVDGGYSGALGYQKLTGVELGGGAPDLRCLDFACRFSFPSMALPGSGSVGGGALRAGRWLRWAVSRVAPGGARSDDGGLAPEEEVAYVSDDVRVAALGLAANLASDLTVAVTMEARLSLVDALARQQPADGAEGMTAVSSGSDNGRWGGGSEGGEGGTEVMVSESRTSSGQARSGSRGGSRGGEIVAHVHDVVPVEPVWLGRARLIVSLTSLGGPTEDRRNRMRRLRDAEALAGAPSGCLRKDAAAVDGPDADCVGVTSQHARGDLRGVPQVAQFPKESLSDEDWWSAARQCVSTVVAVLAKPRGPRTDEAFALLTRAAARGAALAPGQAAAAPHAPGFAGADNRVDRRLEDMPNERVAAEAAAATVTAMEKLLFLYARSLGLTDSGDRDRFGAGLRRTLAAAESVMSPTTSPLFPFRFPPPDCAAGPTLEKTRFDGRGCDWFAAVAFLASGGANGAAASKMMLGASRRCVPIAVSAPPPSSLAGNRRATDGAGAAAAAAVTVVAVRGSAGRAAVPVVGAPPPPRFPPVSAVPTVTRFLPQLVVTESRGADKEKQEQEVEAGVVAAADVGARAGVDAVASPSTSRMGAAAAAGASLGDPPLLLLAALVEEVVEEELPGVSGALRGAGWAVAPLAARWMRQCMLCVVDWPGVVAYLALTLLRGHDYQVYFAVALLRTAQPSVVDAASKGLDLFDLLAVGSGLDGFDLEDALSYMEGLERRHRPRCLAATEAYLAQ